MSKHKLGIVLSGGGARGIAHLGVLDALHKHGIEPDLIAGTSMGAIVGCLYSAGYKPGFILEEIKKERLSKFLSWKLPGDGFLDLEHMEDLLRKHIKKDDFSTLQKSFYVSVSNLHSGKNEVIGKGKLFEVVIASASIPIIFKPRIINGKMYADGGLQNNLPAIAVRDLCERLIGVNVNHSGPLEKINGLMEIAERCLRLAIEGSVKENLEVCDVTIQPDKVKYFNTFDFRKADEIYKTGFETTEAMMDEIREKLGV